MRYFNDSDVLNYRKSIILENKQIANASCISTQDISVFLSYSSKDSDRIESVINFLEKYGVKVYIDKNDNTLPHVPSSETAKKLKENIEQCRKFIVLVSENSKSSKWIPWEVGIADIAKTTANVALLPSTNEEYPSWTSQEYMGLYNPIMNYATQWIVRDRYNNTDIELGKWLRS